ncbi:MAG: hypothetical protein ACSHYF_03965 [Verrucomicrobiaceae bacterium]
MARRASSGVNTQGLLIGAVILIVVLGGGYWFLNRTPAAFDAKPVNVSHAQENGRSLAGNEYSVTGKIIDRKIEDNGQIVALEVEEDGILRILPIMLEPDFQAGNLSLQENYAFLIQFNNDGVAVALEVKQM